jgi:hypothetical protein
MTLLQDSNYDGDDEKGISRYVNRAHNARNKSITLVRFHHRGRFCKQAIALSMNIKNHFVRVLNQQSDRSQLTQILLPYPMPTHLENDVGVVSSCANCSEESLVYSLDTEHTTQRTQPLPEAGCYEVCRRCVNLIAYCEYLDGVLGDRTLKPAKRRYRSKEEYSGKRYKRTRAHSPYDPGPRASSRVAAATALACAAVSYPEDCTADSALLLGMKRARVDRQGFSEVSATSSDAGNSSGSAEQQPDDSSGSAAYHHTDAVHGNPYAALFPHARADSPDMFLQERHPEAGCGGGLTITTGYNAAPASGGVITLSDGRSLHDFLVSCYRDGIYPSPAACTIQQHQLSASSYFSTEGDTTVPSYTDPGTETDADTMREGDRRGLAAQSLQDSCGDGVQEDSPDSSTQQPTPNGTQLMEEVGPVEIGYEDLQQLLVHLLQEPLSAEYQGTTPVTVEPMAEVGEQMEV